MMILIVILLSIAYALSAWFSYYGIRRMLIANEWEADGILLVVMFIPLLNIIWGLLSLADSYKSKGKLNRFFKLKG